MASAQSELFRASALNSRGASAYAVVATPTGNPATMQMIAIAVARLRFLLRQPRHTSIRTFVVPTTQLHIANSISHSIFISFAMRTIRLLPLNNGHWALINETVTSTRVSNENIKRGHLRLQLGQVIDGNALNSISRGSSHLR